MSKYEAFKTIYNQILLNPEIKAQAKQAAVAVVFIELPEQEPHLILIERNQYDGHHSGQIALPGGKMDPTDQDLRETAAREVLEEIGVDIDSAALEYITEHWIHVSNYWMTAFSIRLHKKLNYDLNKREINRIFEIPVAFLKQADSLDYHELEFMEEKIIAPRYYYESEEIWGATAVMLYQLIQLLD